MAELSLWPISFNPKVGFVHFIPAFFRVWTKRCWSSNKLTIFLSSLSDVLSRLWSFAWPSLSELWQQSPRWLSILHCWKSAGSASSTKFRGKDKIKLWSRQSPLMRFDRQTLIWMQIQKEFCSVHFCMFCSHFSYNCSL